MVEENAGTAQSLDQFEDSFVLVLRKAGSAGDSRRAGLRVKHDQAGGKQRVKRDFRGLPQEDAATLFEQSSFGQRRKRGPGR